MPIRSLAVFCGSKSGANYLYSEHARQLGTILASRGIRLIYGGGNKGLMGDIANAVLEASGKVTGIIPEILTKWESQHEGLTELIVVDDMHTRKKMLYEKADAALVLPGGFGTLDELFEMLTWNQLNIHDKRIFILNTNGFYDHLICHMNQLEKEGFLYEEPGKRMIVLSLPAAIEPYLDE